MKVCIDENTEEAMSLGYLLSLTGDVRDLSQRIRINADDLMRSIYGQEPNTNWTPPLEIARTKPFCLIMESVLKEIMNHAELTNKALEEMLSCSDLHGESPTQKIIDATVARV